MRFSFSKVALLVSATLCSFISVASSDIEANDIEVNSMATESIAASHSPYLKSMEKISITGSRIKREEITSTAPMAVFTADDIAQMGATSVDAVLQRMSASAGFAGNQTNAYWTDGGYGSTQVNLRGLGVNRTLVLLNGRRMVNSGTGANSSVDLNTIPVSVIERIEVLKDGASAVYGADAVAGVVNIITKDQIDGVEFQARTGMTEQGDGEQYQFDLAVGKVGERGSGYIALSYDKTDAVEMTSRAPCPLTEVDGELVCSGSTALPGGRGYFLDENGNSIGDEVKLLPNGSDEYTSSDRDNYFEYFNAVQPNERFNVFASGEYDLTDNVQLFTEAMYTHRSSTLPATPQTVSGITIPSWHESNPTENDFLLNSRRLAEAPREFNIETDTWRVVAGLQGGLDNGWQWDAAVNYGSNRGSFEVTNVINNTRLGEATDYDNCSVDPNIPCADFWGEGSLTPEMLDYFLFDMMSDGGNEQLSLTANLTGDLWQLPAGTMSFATGIEHRKEKGWSNPDPLAIIGEANTSQQDPITGEYTADEVYLEAYIPLLADKPLAKAVDLTAAVRYSHFDTFGSDTNYKLGLQWMLNDQLTLRTTKSTAFRVPNIPELFGGISQGSMNTTDPCSDWSQLDPSSNRFANCQAAGVSMDFNHEGTILTDRGGNADLQPEEADTFTVGVVWDVSFIEGLNVTLDYYDIKIENAINSVNGSSKLAACYDSANMSHPFCNDEHFIRDEQTGEITYLQTQLGNAATEEVSGVDLAMFYQKDFGEFTTNTSFEVSYLDEYNLQTYEGAPVEERAGTIGYDGSYTKWRSNLYFDIAKDDWRFGYNIQYIGEADDQYAAAGDIGDSVDAVTYHNTQLYYQLTRSLGFTAGIDNLFDKQAPYHQSYTDGNTNTMTYDLMGRRYYLALKWVM
ncbi:TonB-dependent receptor [Shewanella sp. 10N.286.51.B7]|uniref:TonB-dependent receptor n=1 Tax=Shewanella sp. 10N.286.51.B7 TaxID=1880836 RepID=UPI001F537924|nr:TonB-dependent receptor [Shewanella sp. 10N.286.51.B7]